MRIRFLIAFFCWAVAGCGTIHVQVEVIQPADVTATRLAAALTTPTDLPVRSPTPTTAVPRVVPTATDTSEPTASNTAVPTFAATTAATATATSTSRPAAARTSVPVIVTQVACASSFFFGDLPGYCPTGSARTSTAAFQPFDGGSMVWEGVSGGIYVLYQGGVATYLAQSVYAPWPDATIEATPPPGHVRPTSGFGRVWNNHTDIRRGLGWPWAAEQGYTVQIQPGHSSTGSTGTFMTLPTGRVIEFRDGGWRPVT